MTSIEYSYLRSCYEELRVIKPGNHSIKSKILGLDHRKFEYAAKISSKILSDQSLSLGESIYKASSQCYYELRSNYNLGIILLCAPFFKVSKKRFTNLRSEITKILENISDQDGELILESIKESKPGGLKNYSGIGSLNSKNKIKFKRTMEIGSRWDRISKCYVNNYKEIFDFGLPYFLSMKKKHSYKNSIIMLYMNYLAFECDSHLLRKYNFETANKIKRMSQITKKMSCNLNYSFFLKKFDRYLKQLNLNPGTCADLTVTTLLISKITDIFKFRF